MSLQDLGFTEAEKKDLIRNSKISDGETETNLELDTAENSIIIQSCFIGSMTMPCDIRYIKLFKTKNSNYKVVYSSSSISYADKHQNAFSIFNFDKENKKLTKDSEDYKALRLTLKDFFKDNTPSSILEKYIDNVEPIYSFEGNRLFCSISDNGYSKTLLTESSLKANIIEIEWNGEKFLIKEYKIMTD